jgi:hypothetical protein
MSSQFSHIRRTPAVNQGKLKVLKVRGMFGVTRNGVSLHDKHFNRLPGVDMPWRTLKATLALVYLSGQVANFIAP